MTRDMFNLLRSFQFRKIVVLLMVLTLSWTTLACGGPTAENTPSKAPTANQTQQKKSSGNTIIADGKYDVQQATYNDGDGEYTLFLLNTPAGVPATFRTNNLQMATLTPEEAAAQAYLQVKDGQAALHMPKDFKLEYTHNVVESAENPQTGQVETRVVRQESSFWSPFAGALAGQVVGNLLFSPRHYVPPMYQPGGLMGYGGYGNSYGQAVNSYRERYQAPPAAERNRTVYRSTRSNTGFGSSSSRSSSSSATQRSTGKGFGSSNLKRSNSSSSYRRAPSSGFGSGRSSGFSRSGGRRR